MHLPNASINFNALHDAARAAESEGRMLEAVPAHCIMHAEQAAPNHIGDQVAADAPPMSDTFSDHDEA